MPELSYSVFDMIICFVAGLAAGAFSCWFLNLDLNIFVEKMIGKLYGDSYK